MKATRTGKSITARKLPETVSFRLPKPAMAALAAQAAERGISPGEMAREVLIAYLEDAQRVRLENELAAVRAELEFLRGDFSTAVEALLVLAGAGTVKTLEAQTWVEGRLRQARARQG